jgi:hypothetical protein
MTTKDPRKAIQFMTKKEAVAAAKKLPGYKPADVIRIDVMGFQMWSIADAHMNYVSREAIKESVTDSFMALIQEAEELCEATGKVEVDKDYRTGYFKVTIGGNMFVTPDDRIYKGGKAAVIRLAKQRAAKGSWYILPWDGSGRYRKENAHEGPIKNYEKAEKEADKYDLSKIVIRWLED